MSLKTLTVALFIFFTAHISASHVSGIDINTRFLGNAQLEVQIKIYRDCQGISYSKKDIILKAESSCGQSFNHHIQIDNGFTKEIRRGGSGPTSCQSQSGVQSFLEYIYLDTIILPKTCDQWEFNFDLECCRNGLSNVSSGSAAGLFSINDTSINSSGIFRQGNIQFYEIGKHSFFYANSIDPESDSLVYELSCPLNMGKTPLTFQGGYSCQRPLQNISINSSTGLISLTQNISGKFQLGVITKEYNRKTKKLKGSNLRDLQFIFHPNYNQIPSILSHFHSIKGGGYKNEIINACSSNKLEFAFSVYDPDSSGSLEGWVDTLLYPGAYVTTSYPNLTRTDTAILTFNWNIPASGISKLEEVEIIVKDNETPYEGYFRYRIPINILAGLAAVEDTVICKGTQVATLKAFGSDKYSWSIIPGGDPIIVGPLSIPSNNFTCDTCSIVGARPGITTSYLLKGDSIVGSGCKVQDTVQVVVVPDFNFSISSDTTICSNQNVEIEMSISSPGPFQYKWIPSLFINNPNSRKAMVTLPYDDIVYHGSAKSSQGCIKEGLVKVKVIDFPENTEVVVSDSIVCIKDTINLMPIIGAVRNEPCSQHNIICSNTTETQIPSKPGGSSYFINSPLTGPNHKGRKFQYLIHADTLISNGLRKGPLSSFSFLKDTSLFVGDSILEKIEMSIGCTQATNFAYNGAFEAINEGTVFSEDSINIKNYFNGNKIQFPFNKAYEWDGVSNLVLEFCVLDTLPNSSPLIFGSTYSSPIASYYNSSGSACNYAAYSNNYSHTPIFTFERCIQNDTSQFNYLWTSNSATFIKSAASSNQLAIVDSTYNNDIKLIYTDKTGQCKDTISTKISIVKKHDVKPLVKAGYCINQAPFFIKAFTTGVNSPLQGKWYGNGIIDDTLGIWDPRLSGLGNHLVTYEIKGDACNNTDTSYVNVSKLPDAQITSLGPYCQFDSIVVLSAKTPGGKYYGRGVDSLGILDLSTKYFNVNGGNLDTFNLTHIVSVKGCESSHTINQTVHLGFDTVITETQRKFCLVDSITNFSNAAGNGSWNTLSLITQNGDFNALRAGIGVHSLTIDSVGTCGRSHTIEVEVVGLPKVKIDSQPIFYPPLSNSVFSMSGTPKGGLWNVPYWGKFAQPSLDFTPSTLNIGKYLTHYYYTDTNGCYAADTGFIYICNIYPTKAIITSSSFGSFSSQTSGDKYEWFLNGVLLPFNSKNITSYQYGVYQVVVYSGYCKSLISDPFKQYAVSLNEKNNEQGVLISPNPVDKNGEVFIENLRGNSTVELIDMNGKVILKKHLEQENEILDLSKINMNSGVYFLKVNETSKMTTFKININ